MPLADWIAGGLAETFDLTMPWDIPEPEPQQNADIVAEAERYLQEHTAMRDATD